MLDELTNLLPLSRQRLLTSEYRFRLGVVISWAIVALTSIAAILLGPSYLLLVQSIHTKEVHLTTITSTLSSSDEVALSTRLATLAKETDILTNLSKAPSPSNIVRTALAVPRLGVTLSGLSYTPTTSRKQAQLVLSGSALTRNVLRSYQLALQNTSFARSVDLPVSAYAQDADIPFTITITLVP